MTGGSVAVRPLDEATAPLLAASSRTWAAALPSWLESMRASRSTLLVAYVAGAPVGLAQLLHRDVPELCNVGVLEAHRGSGIGTVLMREAEALARPAGRLRLGVSTDNPRARHLYERLGYRPYGEPLTTSYEYVDADGVRRTATETDQMMEKPLR